MRYGFWAPVFGGWLRNVPDEGMSASWDYMSRLCRRAEEIGYDLTLVAELNLNDIKGADQPALDFLTWLIAVKSGTVKLDDYDREVLKQIASAMPENGSPANPVIDDIVSRILAKLTAGKAAAPA